MGLPGAIQRCALPFSIDNILKPNFGASVPTSARSAAAFLHNPAFFSIAAAAAQQRIIPDRQRSPSSSSSSNGSLVKGELKSPPASPLNHNNNQPVDLSSKS